MALLADIVSHTNELLEINNYKDYCPNGLQVEGGHEVNKIVSGVTASQALINSAIAQQADMILVHHGFFWRGEKEVITGLKKNRICALINHDVSLLAYHLPLDGHQELGNNVQLSNKLQLKVVDNFGPGKSPLGIIANADSPIDSAALISRLAEALKRKPGLLSSGAKKNYERIAICTGAAQNYFEQAIDAGADVFITGEVSEQTYHLAMESGVDFIYAGHHATEKFGVQALGVYLSNQFNIVHEYVDITNPI